MRGAANSCELRSRTAGAVQCARGGVVSRAQAPGVSGAGSLGFGEYESMKSRETLIRLKKFQVDEKRRKVVQIEGMIAEFDRMAADLDREITVEQDRAGIHDPAHFAYPTYAKAALTR